MRRNLKNLGRNILSFVLLLQILVQMELKSLSRKYRKNYELILMTFDF